jgi:hypothetical protein
VGSYGVQLRLHHFTSVDAAENIIRSNQLWATDARHLNDTTELEHGLPICFRALEILDDARFIPYVRILVEGLREQFRKRVFVVCFSESNSRKSQWQSYADAERGFAIAFDNACLSWLWAPPALRLMPVEYGPSAQRNRAEAAVRRALHDIQSCPANSDLDFAFTVHSRFSLLGVELFYLCSTFKAWKWRSEQEWRLVYAGSDEPIDGSLPIHLRSDGVPYVKVDLTRTIDGQPRRIYAAIREGPSTPYESARRILSCAKERGLQVQWEKQPPWSDGGAAAANL